MTVTSDHPGRAFLVSAEQADGVEWRGTLAATPDGGFWAA